MFNRFCRLVNSIVITFCAFTVMSSYEVQSHVPLTQEDRAALGDADDLEERLLRIDRFGEYKVAPGLIQKTKYKIEKLKLLGRGLSVSETAQALYRGRDRAFPYQAQPELISTGTPNTLTVLVEFKDVKGTSYHGGLTQQSVYENIYGNGTSTGQSYAPYESVKAYYQRASENKLSIQGSVLGWHELSKNRDEYKPNIPAGTHPTTAAQIENQALFDLVSEALNSYPAHDFSIYDNDHDGDIDLVTILYAGPKGTWGDFWWAYRWEFFIQDSKNKYFGGKRLKQFVFQFIEQWPQTSDFNPTTLIHETGHALGLPDYYDYCSGDKFQNNWCGPNVSDPGPDGGVGGLDIMDANKGNHNAFSRYLLDWIDPAVVKGGSTQRIELAPSGLLGSQKAKAVAIFPGLTLTGNAPGEELFIVENRTRLGNDAGEAQMPNDGLLIWHVDGTSNNLSTEFSLDNSYTTPKLIRLVRAGTEADFMDCGAGNWTKCKAGASDYFVPGDSFTPQSTPPSRDNSGKQTGVSIKNISRLEDSILADYGFELGVQAALPSIFQSRTNTLGSENQDLAEIDNDKSNNNISFQKLEKLDIDLRTTRPEDISAMWRKYVASEWKEFSEMEAPIAAELILNHWASKDGLKALQAIVENPNSTFRDAYYIRALESWAYSDPEQAGEWYFAPAQKLLRTDGDFSASSNFTRAIFEDRLNSMDYGSAVTAIDNLNSWPEIYGAIQGLTNRSGTSEEPKAKLEIELERLEKRSVEAIKILELQNAYDGALGVFNTQNIQQLDIDDMSIQIRRGD